MSFTYNLGVPNPPNNPAVDVPKMQVNTNSISSWVNIDHVDFAGPNAGYHNVVHFSTQVSNPPTVANIGQLFSKLKTGDTNLFFKSGLGDTTQLTGPAIPTASTNGYTSLAGGIVIQWGQVIQSFASGSTTGTTNFNTPFLSGSFIVVAVPLVSFASLPSSAATVNIRQSSLGGTTSFQWQFYTNSSDYKGFTWIAIGN